MNFEIYYTIYIQVIKIRIKMFIKVTEVFIKSTVEL